MLFGLWGGLLADRYDKRKLLLATQTGLALVALILGVLDVTGIVQYWQVLVLALALGLVSAIDSPVRQSFVVEMVGPDDLTNAVGLNSTIFNSARILGPAVAGVMITAVGTGWAFVANADIQHRRADRPGPDAAGRVAPVAGDRSNPRAATRWAALRIGTGRTCCSP